jgi:hypothetical protein
VKGSLRGTMRIEISVSAGELVDKVTILEIKSERISDPRKQTNINRELANLAAVLERLLAGEPQLPGLKSSLRSINETLWQIEDDLRECERRREFGPRFVELARSVYRSNDRRAAVKRQIDELVGSEIVEEKSYRPYE